MSWDISFKSRNGYDYNIEIAGAGNANLTGGTPPIVTQEDKSDDFFKFVRLQSGYIRYIDDGTVSWTDIMPGSTEDRPVTLTQGYSVKWRGFVQPQTFSGQWREAVQVREIPIMCQLSALGAFNVSPTAASEDVNFGWLLWYIFSRVGTWDRFFFTGDDASRTWLYKRVMWDNIVDRDSLGEPHIKYSCLQLLEEICKFFGWSCRTSGENVYFCAVDDNLYPDWSTLYLSDLQDIGNGGYVSSGSEQTVDIQNTSFANNNNVEMYKRGVRNASVSVDIRKMDTSLIDYPPESLRIEMSQAGSTRYISGTDKYFYITDDVNLFSSAELSGQTNNQMASFNLVERYQGSVLAHGEYNWSPCIFIRSSYNGSYLATLQSQKARAYPPGMLLLSADIYRGFDSLADACSMKIRLGIGYDRSRAEWYDGSSWSSTQSAFNVLIGKNTGIYHNMSNFGTGDPPTAPDIEIPISSQLLGYVFLDFLGSEDVPFDNSNERTFQIENLNIKYHAVFPNSDSVNRYNQSSLYPFDGEVSINTAFASYNDNYPGEAIIMEPDKSYCRELMYSRWSGGFTEHPELHLAARIAFYWSYTRKMFDINLRSNDDITPANTVMYCWPLSISHDWRDDVVNLKLIEL